MDKRKGFLRIEETVMCFKAKRQQADKGKKLIMQWRKEVTAGQLGQNGTRGGGGQGGLGKQQAYYFDKCDTERKDGGR